MSCLVDEWQDSAITIEECTLLSRPFFFIIVIIKYLPKALNRATISLRVSWKRILFIDAKSNAVGSVWSKGPEKRIFKAVPSPCVCSLPHTLHFSQPTQSMMRVILRKWWRNSSFNFLACFPPVNMVDSLKWGLKDLKFISQMDWLKSAVSTSILWTMIKALLDLIEQIQNGSIYFSIFIIIASVEKRLFEVGCSFRDGSQLEQIEKVKIA